MHNIKSKTRTYPFFQWIRIILLNAEVSQLSNVIIKDMWMNHFAIWRRVVGRYWKKRKKWLRLGRLTKRKINFKLCIVPIDRCGRLCFLNNYNSISHPTYLSWRWFITLPTENQGVYFFTLYMGRGYDCPDQWRTARLMLCDHGAR